MKNKKLATLSVALGLSTIALIGGISAYFTDGDEATNEFTVGGVSLELQEPNFVPPTNILPNQVIKKDPQILNNGINDEFVFMEVQVPVERITTADLDGTVEMGEPEPASAAELEPVKKETELFTYEVNPGWVQIGKDMVKGSGNSKSITRIYAYGTEDAMTPLAKDATTPALFDEVKFCNAIEGQSLGFQYLEGSTQAILVGALGIQTTDINDGDGADKTSPEDVFRVLMTQQGVPSEILDDLFRPE